MIGAQETIRIKAIGWTLAIFWSLALCVSLAWNYLEEGRYTGDLALTSLRISLQKDMVYRRWASEHGGVYVPITPRTPPNPYLSHVPERDITTPSGRRLTLVNPAYMTRQVQELGKEQYGERGHITSLNPLRPGNGPDSWEKESLLKIDSGAREVVSTSRIGGENYLRLMVPFYTEEGCLKCHASQGYKLGDLRGGISVSTSMAPFERVLSLRRWTLGLGHLGVWIVGLAGIWLTALRLHAARQSLLDSHNQLEQRVEERTAALQVEIAERKEIQNQLTAANQDLRGAIVRTEQLARQAEAASRAKTAFLAGMSHEIRTPMNGVLGMAELLLETELTERQRRFAEKIRSSGGMLLAVMNDILDFSEIEAGKLKLENRPFSMQTEVVEKTVAPYHSLAEQKGVLLRTRIDPALPPLLSGDARRLSQVLGNLLSNAVKFTDAGEIELSVRFLDLPDNQVSLAIQVRDTGIGLHPDSLPMLFESFQQADGSLARRYGGRGLGLTICKRLVTLMGGRIQVESSPGTGSVFTVLLPLTVPPDPPDLRPEEQAKDRTEGIAPKNGPALPPGSQEELAELLAGLKEALGREEPKPCKEIMGTLIGKRWDEKTGTLLHKLNGLIESYRLSQAFDFLVQSEKEMAE